MEGARVKLETDELGQPTDASLIHRKVTIEDILRLAPLVDDQYPRKSNHERGRLVLRFGSPTVGLCCVRVLGVVLRLQRDDTQKKLVLLIDDSTGVVQVEYPTINLHHLLKQPAVGDLFDFLGEIHLDPSGSRFIRAYGMDYKKDGNWEALRYLEIVDLYRHHYYREAFEAETDHHHHHDMDVAPPEQKKTGQSDVSELERKKNSNRAGRHAPPPPLAAQPREEMLPYSQDQRILSSPADSSSSARDSMVLDSPPMGHGPGIEAMLRQMGSATLADIARRFPHCNNLIALLESMMLDGLVYEKEGRYHPL